MLSCKAYQQTNDQQNQNYNPNNHVPANDRENALRSLLRKIALWRVTRLEIWIALLESLLGEIPLTTFWSKAPAFAFLVTSMPVEELQAAADELQRIC